MTELNYSFWSFNHIRGAAKRLVSGQKTGRETQAECKPYQKGTEGKQECPER